MADELIDIFDENNKPLNIQKMKSEAHRDGLWHRTAHIWIYNSKKEILLQLRAKDKDIYPDCWDISVAGHVGAGEDEKNAALREIKEEIGLSVKKEELQFVKIRKEVYEFMEFKDAEFYYVYLLKYDGDFKKMCVQKEELQKVKFFPVTELEKELNAKTLRFVSHGKYWDEMIELIKKAD